MTPADPGLEYSIQEAAAKLGIPIHKLRRWDRDGVLVARRTEGGHRRYGREIIDSLAAAGLAGMDQSEELAAIKQALEDKRRIIRLLLDSEQRYRDLVEASHDLIWATDAQGRFTYLNASANDIFGLPPEDLRGRCFFDFESEPSHVANRRFLAMLRKNDEVKNFVTHVVGVDGRERWISINARQLRNGQGVVTELRGTARDITEQHLAALKLKTDPLTGLENRGSLQRKLEEALAAQGHGALLLLDIDHFKYINERFGHHAGDKFLVGIASVLSNVLKEVEAGLYRVGGDEFAILLPDTLRQQAAEVAERALQAVRRYAFVAKGKRQISNFTVSIGIALYPFHGGDAVSLIGNADIALYQAKGGGRNRSTLFDQDARNIRDNNRRVHWAARLRTVLDQDRLLLYAQPALQLAERRPVHQEVLVRMRGDDGAIIGPEQFIEIAESLRLIQEIDLAVVQKLLRHVEARGAADTQRYFVNLSQVSMSDARWMRGLTRTLLASRVDPGRLVFEISESAAMAEVDATERFAHEIRQAGCRFAIDGFGSGFNSFYYLKRLQIDYLTIDGALTRDFADERSDSVYLKALHEMAQGLARQVIAQWVETPDALARLISSGVRFGQGYLFQRPLPLETPPASDDDIASNVA